MKFISHAPVPKDPWSLIMIAMQEESDFLGDEQVAELQRREDFLWGILGHYLYKKRWNSKHKIPFRQTLIQRRAIDAYGDFWDTLIELTINCHGYAAPNSSKYRNAAEWISLIVQEKRFLKNSKILEGNIKKGKVKLAENLRAKAKLLEGNRNPENQNISPHIFRLYEDALHLIRQDADIFCDKYWIPHIKALRSHVRELERNLTWTSIYIEDDKLFEQTQRRARILVLPPKSSKNALTKS